MLLCIIGAVGCYAWLTSFKVLPIPYLTQSASPFVDSFLIFWTYIIILQVMIPLSLYVTLELCKILQVYHIHNSIDLYDEDSNKKTECRAMNITEELGQIQHIFSDKTGTLTENKMLFRNCIINGNDYNHPASEVEKAYSKPGSPAPPVLPNTKLLEDMRSLMTTQYFSPNAQRMQDFLLVMAICNTVVVGSKPHRDIMNASGVIEAQQDGNYSIASTSITSRSSDNTITVNVSNGTPSSISNDRYTRLLESRSVTPSPPPNLGFPLPTQNHIPSLSPISSSNETTPTSESPPLKAKNANNNGSGVSPTGRAKAVLNSKINSLAAFINSKGQLRKLGKVK